ncbi:hypothetical protein CHARACLAT_008161, partial [Characodon lateralis]|nr:hypothetical protein [Characodon lateralis]
MPYLRGTLGIAIRHGEILGLRDFLLRTKPGNNSNNENTMIRQFWEYTFQCRFAPPPVDWLEAGGALCSGDEDLETVQTEFLDVSNLRPEYNIYKAVYALAYALNDMLQCQPGRGPFSRQTCASLQRLEAWQPPQSVCSETCNPGTRMARKKGQPVCCFDCVPCSEGKISNETNSVECFSCQEDFWSSPKRDHCVLKTIEFLSYHEPLGVCLTTASLLGTCICIVVLGIFTYHHSTPMPGDVILGGLFEVHYSSAFPEQTFTSAPHQHSCQGFDSLGFRHAMTMAFAVDEINRNSSLLPNVSLGYSLYDNCATLSIGFSAALAMASGQEEQFLIQENCSGTPPVVGIVGDPFSTFSIAASNVLGLYKMPLVRAMIQILKHFGWTWAGLLVSDDDYGLHVSRSFQTDLTQSDGGCLAYTEVLPWGDNPSEYERIVGVMTKSTAHVVIVFAHQMHMIQLMEQVVKQNLTGLQWIASEAWTLLEGLQIPAFMPFLGGTLGIAIRRGEIPGLRDFLLRIHPEQHGNNISENSMVKLFWEHTFECKFIPPPAGWVEDAGAQCTGKEDLNSVKTDLLDVAELRPEYNIYKAVYALAHALNDTLSCVPGQGPFRGNSCASLQTLEHWQ